MEKELTKVEKFLDAKFVGDKKGSKGKSLYFFQNEKTGTEYMYTEKNLQALLKKLGEK
jgi:hypothetical protein